MEIRVLDTDTWQEAAKKIFKYFDVMQSCSIRGHVIEGEDVKFKGDLVLDELRRLDKLEYLQPAGKLMQRKRVKVPNSIGGYVAQKIFRYDRVEGEGTCKVDIWRLQ